MSFFGVSIRFNNDDEDFNISTDDTGIEEVGLEYFHHPEYLVVFTVAEDGTISNFLFKHDTIESIASHKLEEEEVEEVGEEGNVVTFDPSKKVH